MREGLRALAIAHWLLLGFVLVSPLIAPALLPWGTEALFVISAFQLRLTDRRWASRAGLRGWISHVRMAPARLIPWIGIAAVAGLAEPHQAGLALSVAIAILFGELLIYPLVANLLGRMPRILLAGVLILTALGCGLADPGQVVRFALAFTLGISASVFWLRGPDGETGSLMIAVAGILHVAVSVMILPRFAPFALPLLFLFSVLALAHLSVMRRHPLHWRFPDGSHRFTQQPKGTKAASEGFGA